MKRRTFVKKIVPFFVLGLLLTNLQSCQLGKKQKTLKIGAILPLTGNAAIIGEPERIAIELAVEKLNKDNSSTIVQVITKDSQGSPANAVTLAQELISKDNVETLIVSTSASVLSVKSMAKDSNIPLFAITSQPDIADGKTVFRISPNSAKETQSVMDYMKVKKIKQIALIYPNNDLGLKIRQVVEQNQPDVVLPLATDYKVGEKDFRTLIVKLKELNIDAVFFAGYPFDIPTFAKQLKESDLKVPLFTSMAAVWPTATQELVNLGVSPIFPSPAFGIANLQSQNSQTFARDYQLKTSTAANYDSAFTYDTVMTMYRLLSLEKSSDSLAKKWTDLGQIEGVSGKINFLENGETSIPLYMATIKDKTVIEVKDK